MLPEYLLCLLKVLGYGLNIALRNTSSPTIQLRNGIIMLGYQCYAWGIGDINTYKMFN
ncbi:TPA: hypothetical protein I8Y81_002249 [Legionella pneumophila]|jgi:hypothetical protein|nr:hypothetical protein [Legionella pneumophila]HDP0036584.1 hypothetical protein [Legionella pneumophila]HEN4769819.1 hypothetical protein [Legionella pneumophila]